MLRFLEHLDIFPNAGSDSLLNYRSGNRLDTTKLQEILKKSSCQQSIRKAFGNIPMKFLILQWSISQAINERNPKKRDTKRLKVTNCDQAQQCRFVNLIVL